MERLVGVVAGGPGDGSTSGDAGSTVQEVEQERRTMSMSSVEVSSYPDETDLDLGLGLGLGSGHGGVGKQQQVARIPTAKDLPSKVPRTLAAFSPSPSVSSSSPGGRVNHDNDHDNKHSCSGNIFSARTKRTADSVISPSPGASQVVGWPPVRSYRVNSLGNQAKPVVSGDLNSTAEKSKSKGVVYGARDKSDAHPMQRGHLKGSLFVKVTMDGIGIGRKVNLSAHSCYESMALALEDMFSMPSRILDTLKSNGEASEMGGTRVPKLLDGTFDYVLIYEDKDGDWMLVGDVPWGMFIGSLKRLRIMKTCEAKGLAPSTDAQNGKQRFIPM